MNQVKVKLHAIFDIFVLKWSGRKKETLHADASISAMRTCCVRLVVAVMRAGRPGTVADEISYFSSFFRRNLTTVLLQVIFCMLISAFNLTIFFFSDEVAIVRCHRRQCKRPKFMSHLWFLGDNYTPHKAYLYEFEVCFTARHSVRFEDLIPNTSYLIATANTINSFQSNVFAWIDAKRVEHVFDLFVFLKFRIWIDRRIDWTHWTEIRPQPSICRIDHNYFKSPTSMPMPFYQRSKVDEKVRKSFRKISEVKCERFRRSGFWLLVWWIWNSLFKSVIKWFSTPDWNWFTAQ